MDLTTTKPRISVVTVMLNALDDFRVTAQSVKGQTYSNLEYIVIDGGSTDGTQNFVAENRGDFAVYISEKDTGIYNAMNKAVTKCSGEYVIFMNAADEFSSPTTVTDIVNKADFNADFIYGDRYRTEVNGIRTYEKAGELSNIYYTEVIYHQAIFNRRTLLLQHPYDESYRLAADYKFALDRYTDGFKFHYVPIPICNFKSGGRSRQEYLLGASEAARAAFNHLKDRNEWKKTQFVKSISLNNCEYYLSSVLKDITTSSKVTGKKINNMLTIADFDSDPFAKGVLQRLLTSLDSKGFLKTKSSYPKISILTVVFNDKQGLLRTIESVKALDYPNIEFVVIDGDSNDGTKEVLEKCAGSISIAVSEPDKGIYDAMNKAIDLATGYYSIFMNAGDEFAHKDALTKVFTGNCFNDEFDVIYGDREYVSGDQVTLQKANAIDTINVRMPFCHQAAFTKTSVLLKNKFDMSMKSAADYNQLVKLYKAGAKFKYANTLVCKFYAGGTSEEGIIPYLEAIKIQIDNFGLSETKRNSFYYKAFHRNVNQILGED